LILQRDQRRRQGYGWFCLRDAIDHPGSDVDFAVRVVGIAFAVSAKQCRPVPEIWKKFCTIPASRRSRIGRSRSASLLGAM
jgi:hypothetical protein